MLDMFDPLFERAENVRYLGYRDPFKYRDTHNVVMLFNVNYRGDEASHVRRELEKQYNTWLIETGRVSRHAPEDMNWTMRLYLNGDNHDGFLFTSEGQEFMLTHSDGNWYLHLILSPKE